MITPDQTKILARELERHVDIGHCAALEAVARAAGHRDRNTFTASRYHRRKPIPWRASR
ncbi:glyoxalase superfamily protein [Tsukamurella soli]|uniref:glyoxalase superfamily protein n=1 Tax=Tsukamurella soli TaxID=644556 RepID=UPI0036237F34